MPSDITGTEVLQEDKTTGQRVFKFLHGPLFANVVLADEINRTPPKTQAALLEAMQERQVTVGGTRHKLPDPFFVLATQNPIEQEGTYPLPEAQQDRFMFNIFVDYPEEEEEFQIVEQTTTTHTPHGRASAVGDRHPGNAGHRPQSAGGALRDPLCDEVHAADAQEQAGSRRARLHPAIMSPGAPARERRNSWCSAAKARAVLHGRYYVSCEDIRAVAAPVLRHRIITNFNAEAEGIKPDDLVKRLADMIPRNPAEKLATG